MEEFYKALPYPFAHSIFPSRPSDVLQSRGVRSRIIYPISLFPSGILPRSLLDVYGFEDYRPVILEKFFCPGLSTDFWWFCPISACGAGVPQKRSCVLHAAPSQVAHGAYLAWCLWG